MALAHSEEKFRETFRGLDIDKEGFIKGYKVLQYASSLKNPPAEWEINNVMYILEDKINVDDFVLLAEAMYLEMIQIAAAKFAMAKKLSKFISASPSAAGTNILSSYFRVNIKNYLHNSSKKLQFIHGEIGIDREHQEKKIEIISKLLQRRPHYFFCFLKIRTVKNAGAISDQMQNVFNELIEFGKGLMPENYKLINSLTVSCKHDYDYVYVIVEINNSFLDKIVRFANELILSLSPNCDLTASFKLAADVADLLKEHFDYSKGNGLVYIKMDIDSTTQEKIKEVIVAEQGEGNDYTPPGIIAALLFQYLKIESTVNNFREALQSIFQTEVYHIPKPIHLGSGLQYLGIKLQIDQQFPKAGKLLDNIKAHCHGEGEISINLRDIFIKFEADLNIEGAFDLL